MAKKKQIMYPCSKCDREFTTPRGVASHQKAHPYVPPTPPPSQRTERLPEQLLETHNLLNGDHLKLGDVFYRVEKHVIKAITYTQGTRTVKVESEKLRSNWQANEPN